LAQVEGKLEATATTPPPKALTTASLTYKTESYKKKQSGKSRCLFSPVMLKNGPFLGTLAPK
jgi:hypothetical protein